MRVARKSYFFVKIRLEAIASLHLLGTLLELLLLDLRQLAVVAARHALYLLLGHSSLLRELVHVYLEVGGPLKVIDGLGLPERCRLLLLLVAQIVVTLVQVQRVGHLQVLLEYSHALDLVLGLELSLLRPQLYLLLALAGARDQVVSIHLEGFLQTHFLGARRLVSITGSCWDQALISTATVRQLGDGMVGEAVLRVVGPGDRPLHVLVVLVAAARRLFVRLVWRGRNGPRCHLSAAAAPRSPALLLLLLVQSVAVAALVQL